MMDRIHVVMSGNNKVFEGICLCALSILKHTKSPVTLHIMTMRLAGKSEEITSAQADQLRAVMQSINASSEVEYIDTTDDYMTTFAVSPNSKPFYTPYSLIRLFVQRHIKSDKVIYLDVDIMTAAPLEELTAIDISEYEMAVALDYLGKTWIAKDYFNSGMLYINMEKVRETNLFENAIELLMREKLFFADQSALYKLCKQRLLLPMRFNEQRGMKPDTVIKHFNKGIKWLPFVHPYNVKQWQRSKVHKVLKIREFDDIYAEYDRLFANNNAVEESSEYLYEATAIARN